MAGLEGIDGVELNGLDVATEGDCPGAAAEYEAFPGAYVVSLPGEYLTIEGEPVAAGEAIGAVDVDVDAEATRDGRTGRGRVTGDSTSLGAPSIDLAAEDPQVVRDRRRPGPRFRPPCCSIPPRTGRRARPRGQARPSSSRSRGSTQRPGWKPDLSA